MDWEKVDLSGNEVRINITEFFWDLLDQWKALMLAGAVVAAVLAGYCAYSSVGSMKIGSVSNDASTEDDRTYDEIVAALPELQKTALDTAISYRDTLQSYIEYRESSPLMKVNSLEEKKAVAVTDIQNIGGLTAEELNEINSKIGYFFAGDIFFESMKERLGWDYKTEYVRELISSSGAIVNFDPSVTELPNGAERCTCVMIKPVDYDGEDFQKVFGEVIADFMGAEFASYRSKYNISPYDYYETTAPDTNTTALQDANSASIASYRSNSDAYKAALQTDALRAYGLYYNEDVSEEMEALEGTAPEDEAEPSMVLSIPAALILGFLAGIVFYAVIFFARQVLFPRAGRMMVMPGVMPGMYAGTLIDLQKGKKSLLRSPLVEKYRLRNRMDLEGQGRSVRKVIDFNHRHSKETSGRVSFVYWSNIRDEHLRMLDVVKNEKDVCLKIDARDKGSAYTMADEAQNVVLIMEDRRTSLKDITDFLKLLKRAGCNVLGYVYLV